MPTLLAALCQVWTLCWPNWCNTVFGLVAVHPQTHGPCERCTWHSAPPFYTVLVELSIIRYCRLFSKHILCVRVGVFDAKNFDLSGVSYVRSVLIQLWLCVRVLWVCVCVCVACPFWCGIKMCHVSISQLVFVRFAVSSSSLVKE
jgi:hypothetical protein